MILAATPMERIVAFRPERRIVIGESGARTPARFRPERMNSPLELHEVRLRGLHLGQLGAAPTLVPRRVPSPSPTQFVGEGRGGGRPARAGPARYAESFASFSTAASSVSSRLQKQKRTCRAPSSGRL